MNPYPTQEYNQDYLCASQPFLPTNREVVTIPGSCLLIPLIFVFSAGLN